MFAIQRHDNYYYRKHFVLLVIKWIEGQANQPPRSTLTIAGECNTNSNPDTNRTEGSVHIREMSLFQGLNCMQVLFLGKEKASSLEIHCRSILRCFTIIIVFTVKMCFKLFRMKCTMYYV